MPSFIRTKKDEALWQKAKQAAAKSKNKDEESFSDQDWALVNHIYHQMKKGEEFSKSTDSLRSIEKATEELEKARRRLSDESVDPLEADDYDESEDLGEGFREFDPDEEGSAADDWLRENDPEYGKGEAYEEYSDDEDEDAHQRGIAEDLGDLGEDQDLYEPEEVAPVAATPTRRQKVSEAEQAPKATIRPEDTPQEASGKRGRFRQPTREEIVALRAYTRPWEHRAREIARLKADPSKNPVLAHQGSIIEARNQAHAAKKAAYQQMISSDEYKNADPITQMEMEDRFEAEWHAKNPDHMLSAMQQHHEAHEKGKTARDLHAAAKDARIQSIISGGIHSPDAFSVEEGLQHVGGVKGEEGTEGSIKMDPAASFAAGNQEFIQEYAKNYQSKSKKPTNIDEMMDYNEGSKRDITRILGPAPASDPKFEEFFSHYYPLIGISAHKTLKKLGLDPKHPDIDMSLLHEAGMHGLVQAINDYDHDNPSKASFATHAANKIRGLQMTALRNQDAIPAEIRQAQKKHVMQSRMNKLLSDKRHPDIDNINDRLRRVSAYKTAPTQTVIRRPGGASISSPKQDKQPAQAPSSPPSVKNKIPSGGGSDAD
ncbi:MAG: hypothetical protein QXG63_04800 [Nitrososphaerales archaeon]